jgi:S-formylglutathione hydrolase
MTPALDAFTTLSEHRCFGGTQGFHSHESREIGLPMRFSVFLPPQAGHGPVPALIYLAGLTCNEETFPIKAGAQRLAAELGLALVAPDTSPRGAQVPGESESWDFGVGAGFYLDATEAPWATHWRMESYLMDELVPALPAHLPIDAKRLGIFGHSMGGHGALTLALRHPGVFRSLSALAPICAPTQCAWGEKAFTGYLGADRAAWAGHDAVALLERQPAAPYPGGILVDQGTADKFLVAGQLHPELLEAARERIGQPLALRRHEGHDHGYYFIQSVIGDHLAHHARALGADGQEGTPSLAATTMAASA